MECFTVGGVQEHVVVFQIEPVRGDVGDLVWIEEHAAATGLQQQSQGQAGAGENPQK